MPIQATNHGNRGYTQNRTTPTPRGGYSINTTPIEIVQEQWTQTEEFLAAHREEQNNRTQVITVNNLRSNRVLERKTGDPFATALFGNSNGTRNKRHVFVSSIKM